MTDATTSAARDLSLRWGDLRAVNPEAALTSFDRAAPRWTRSSLERTRSGWSPLGRRGSAAGAGGAPGAAAGQ